MSLDRKDFLGVAGVSALLALGANAEPAEAAERHRIIYSLPKSEQRRFAWTIDDGVSPGSIATYTQHALEDPSLKYTYFVTSSYSSWRRNKTALTELIASGQVQLANHTRSHPDLRTLTNKQIERNFMDCHKFIEDTFQVNPMPFWRPPYGYYDWRVLKVAADIGYTAPTMWYGTLATDSKNLTRTRLKRYANLWINNGSVVIDHANNMVAANNFDILKSVIHAKGLSMITLREAFPAY